MLGFTRTVEVRRLILMLLKAMSDLREDFMGGCFCSSSGGFMCFRSGFGIGLNMFLLTLWVWSKELSNGEIWSSESSCLRD